MADGFLNRFFGYGTAAEVAADAAPSEPTVVLGLAQAYMRYSTDTKVFAVWNGATYDSFDFDTIGSFSGLYSDLIGLPTLGTSSAIDTGTSGAKVPLLNAANTWTLAQTFTAAPVFTDASGSRTALGLGSLATASTINGGNWSGTDLAITDGGTGASTAGGALTNLGVSAFVQTILDDADAAAVRATIGAGTGTGSGDLLASNNLSDLANAGTARTNLGLAIGTNVQAYDADLTTWAGLTPSANAQSLVTAANYAAMRTLLGLVVGTDVQAFDSDLASIAALTTTSFGRALLTAADGNDIKPTESLIIACSDETTAITAGTAKVTFRMPYAFTVTAVRASVTTAPTGSTILIDINEGGTTIISTKLMIDASEKTSTTAATPAVISDSSLADDAEITIDFDQVGSTIAGAGVKVYLIGHRT